MHRMISVLMILTLMFYAYLDHKNVMYELEQMREQYAEVPPDDGIKMV